jgi:hypothetical protein
MEDLIEVLSEHFTEQEIREMNPYQAQDEYNSIMQDRNYFDAAEAAETRHWDNVATFHERFSGDYHD